MGRGCRGTKMTLNREFLGHGARFSKSVKKSDAKYYYLTNKKRIGSKLNLVFREKPDCPEGGFYLLLIEV